jgi:Ca2+-binding RTX toxin-like protein
MPALIHAAVPFHQSDGIAAVLRGPGAPGDAGEAAHTGHLQWAWDFAVASPVSTHPPVLAIAEGVVVDVADGFAGPDDLFDDPDFSFGNFITLRHELDDGRVVFATYAHLDRNTMPHSGTGPDLRGHRIEAGGVIGAAAPRGDSPGDPAAVPHVQVHFGTTTVTLERDGYSVTVASGLGDTESPVAFPAPGFPGADTLPAAHLLDAPAVLEGTGAAELLTTFGSGEALVDPGGGNDTVVATNGQVTVMASAGNDRIDGRDGEVTVDYSGGPVLELSLSLGDVAQPVGPGDSDVLIGVEHLIGSGFDDALTGSDSDNHLQGMDGNDTILGGGGQDTLRGGDGNDALLAGDGDDTLLGGGGADSLAGEDHDDAMLGGAGDDLLEGGAGADVLFGEAGADVLSGGGGDDSLAGGGGDDLLHGGAGDDLLVGDGGADTLAGGDGADVFRLAAAGDSPDGPGARDLIADLDAGDRIDLSAIDADATTPGDDAFVFIGDATFSAVAGELSFRDGVLAGDVDGDGIADFAIAVEGTAVPVEAQIDL